MKLTTHRKRCKIKDCHDPIVGCGDTHSDWHARVCKRNKFCYAHCRIDMEDNCARVDLYGKISKSGPRYIIALTDMEGNYVKLKEPLPMDCPVTYNDLSEEILDILKDSECGLTVRRIGVMLRKKGLEIAKPGTVLREVRKLGKAVSRSGNVKHRRLFSYSRDGETNGQMEEAEDFADALDRFETFLEANEDAGILDFPKFLRSGPVRQEDHIWL